MKHQFETQRNGCGLAGANDAKQQIGTRGLEPGRSAREIPSKISLLTEMADLLSEKLARLGQRLSPVVASLPPSAKDSTGPGPCSTELGGALSQLQARFAVMIDAVESMDERLEL